MIDFNKSFQENTENNEYSHYIKIVENLMATGDIDPKHSLLLNNDDLAVIVKLGIIYLRDNNLLPNVKNEASEDIRNKVSNVIKLCAHMTNQDRFYIASSMGLEFMLNHALDEIPEFESAMRWKAGIMYRPKPPPTKEEKIEKYKEIFTGLINQRIKSNLSYDLGFKYAARKLLSSGEDYFLKKEMFEKYYSSDKNYDILIQLFWEYEHKHLDIMKYNK